MKKTKEGQEKIGVVIFTEGETDEVFYRYLVSYLIKNFSQNSVPSIIEFRNIKGVGNYANKAPNIFKNEILIKNTGVRFIVVCAYDNDVFKFKLRAKPMVDWNSVNKKFKDAGALKVIHLKAEDMIEDWFLKDVDGLCKYLNIEKVTSLPGKTGEEKMKALFRKRNKVYQKGFYVEKFMDSLNFDLLYKKLQAELIPLTSIIVPPKK